MSTTTMSYDEAMDILIAGEDHPEWDERHHEAWDTVTRAVWRASAEEGDGYGEMFNWVADGRFSEPRAAFSVEALAAEWDAMQRAARDL